MPLDTDRCHFCRRWTKEHEKIGDRSICESCFNELVEKIKAKL